MIVRIAISKAAFEAIAATLPLGSMGYEGAVLRLKRHAMKAKGCGATRSDRKTFQEAATQKAGKKRSNPAPLACRYSIDDATRGPFRNHALGSVRRQNAN